MAHSQYNYRETLDRLVRSDTRWLDLGCGHTILPEWIRDSVPFQKELLSRCELARGCDPVDDRPHVAGLTKTVYQGDSLPFPDGFFNLVTANMVVEHVADPVSFMQQVQRVLSTDGLFVAHTSNFYYFEYFIAHFLPSSFVSKVAHYLDGRDSEDIFPTHYRMNTRSAFRRLPGFTIQSLECVTTGPKYTQVPILNLIERSFIGLAAFPALRDLRSDWIVVLQKVDVNSSSAQ
ncbi:MAG: class I SAM-dependent methyltransferase [Acidobacteriaceae bacterium]